MLNRRVQIVGRAVLALVSAGAIGIGLAKLIRAGQGWPQALLLVGAAGLLGLAILAALPWWRRIDDAAQEAHQTAWWWGGSFGLGVGVVSTIVLGGPQSQMVHGAVITFGCGLVAYVVAWAYWWLTRRPALAA